jgi:hypothetical protein
MDSNSLLTSIMQLAERSKRNLRAAPGQIADQISNFVPDWQATSAAVPSAIKSSTGKTDEEVFKKAIEETAGNAIPGGAGAAGIFGGAGRQDLFAARGTNINSLLRRILASKRFGEKQSLYDRKKAVSADPVVQHPSIAINKTDPRNNDFYEDALVIYNPAAIDPATNWRSHLINRDSYSYRSDWVVRGGEEAMIRRLIDRKNPNTGKSILLDPRMTENTGGSANFDKYPDSHRMQIFSSPEFKSFAEYEASPAGAAILDSYANLGSYGKKRVRDSLDRAMDFYMSKLASSGQQLTVKNMNKFLDSEGTTTAKAVKDLLQRAPSNYAELKYRGPLPINSETTLAVLLRDANKKDQNTISSALRGVQVINDKQLLGTDEVLELLQEGARNPHLARIKKQQLQPATRSGGITYDDIYQPTSWGALPISVLKKLSNQEIGVLAQGGVMDGLQAQVPKNAKDPAGVFIKLLKEYVNLNTI